MAINFPNNPTTGEEITLGDTTYRYTGVFWDTVGGSGGSITPTPTPTGGGGATLGPTAPGTPTNGDLWYNTDICRLFVWYEDGDSGQWVSVSSAGAGGGSGGSGSISTGVTAPTSPSNGDLWYNTDICRLLVWYHDGDSGQWIAVSNEAGGIGYTGSAGPAGLQGPIGYTGSAGSGGSGSVGYTGSVGATGLQGPIGYTGSVGASGPAGATGGQGPIGYTGSQGIQGATGPQGTVAVGVGVGSYLYITGSMTFSSYGGGYAQQTSPYDGSFSWTPANPGGTWHWRGGHASGGYTGVSGTGSTTPVYVPFNSSGDNMTVVVSGMVQRVA